MNTPTIIFITVTALLVPLLCVLAVRTQLYGSFGRAWCRTVHIHRDSSLGKNIKRCTSCRRPWHG